MFKSISTLRPFAGQNADAHSSLWATNSAGSAKMIDESQNRLKAFRDGFVTKA